MFQFTLHDRDNKPYAVTPLSASDIEDIFAIECRISPIPWSRRNITSSVVSSHHCLGVKSSGQWIGYCIFSAVAGDAEILLIGIDKPYQNKGLAAAILDGVIERLEGRAQTIFLEVRASNIAAINLYEKMGFNCIGERRNYYPAVKEKGLEKEDALIYAYSLGMY